MLKNQEKFLSYLQELQNATSGLIKCENIQKLSDEVKNAQLFVPVIGGFSAGKSTILNSLLGKEILPTDIEPTTAVACELHYANTQKAIGVQIDGNEIDLNFNGFLDDAAKSQEMYRIKLFLNEEILKEIEPFVLVDMPGFGSRNSFHNDALNETLFKNAVHFIVLNAAERGTTEVELSEQLNKISRQKKSFSFALSKIEDCFDIESVVANSKTMLNAMYSYNDAIECLGIDDGEKLLKIIKSLDAEEILKKEFLEKLQDNHKRIENSLEIKKRALGINSDSLKEQLEITQNELNKLKDNQNNMHEISDFSIREKSNLICAKVIENLSVKSENFASTALNGGDIRHEFKSIIEQSTSTQTKDAIKALELSL